MAWVTIRTANGHKFDTASADERRWVWQRGDIVDITSGHPGPAVTASGKMLAIHIPGVAVETLQDLIEAHQLGRRLRQWRFDDAVAAMPQAARRKILDAIRDRTDIELTQSQLAWIRDYIQARI